MSSTDEFTAADRGRTPRFDEIGYWSEIKLEIVRDYAQAYTKALSKQDWCRGRFYIDAFAGAGIHIARSSGEFVQGSPLNALAVRPPFDRFYFIDLDSQKVAELKAEVADRSDVDVQEGDCNRILLEQVFPLLEYKEFRRALCLLDPYGLDLAWDVVLKAGQLRTIDIFVNFPVMDMNRNVLCHNPEAVSARQAARLTAYWGDESWRQSAYQQVPDLFDERYEKVTEANDAIARAYGERLVRVAGFKNVPEPLAMRNSKGATVYYLFFASHVGLANTIVSGIMNKYRSPGRAHPR